MHTRVCTRVYVLEYKSNNVCILQLIRARTFFVVVVATSVKSCYYARHSSSLILKSIFRRAINGTDAETKMVNDASTFLDESQGPWQEAREGEFEMMDISLTAIGLTGIVSEAIQTKKKKGNVSSKLKRTSTLRRGRAASIGQSSSMASFEDNPPHIPVTAVASFFKFVTSNKTSIGTHIPSLDLAVPTSSFGNTSRYVASWASPGENRLTPGERREFKRPGSNGASFQFSRVMKRQIVPGSWDGEDRSVIEKTFIHETMDILVGLTRGSEMIPLGVATLVITGEELGEVQMSLPVKVGPEAIQNMDGAENLRKSHKNLFKRACKKRKKGAYFKNSPTSRYRLDGTSSLCVLVKTVPRNGGYDVEGSVVSALSCPTGSLGSSLGSTSESSNENSDYSSSWEEPSRPSNHSRQTPHLSGIPTPPPQFASASYSMERPHSMGHMAATLPQQSALITRSCGPNVLQVHSDRLLSCKFSDIQIHAASSEASSEPGYGDEFEGASNTVKQKTKLEEPQGGKDDPGPTTMSTSISSSGHSSLVFQRGLDPEPSINSMLQCGSFSNLCLGEEEPVVRSRGKRRRPPAQIIF